MAIRNRNRGNREWNDNGSQGQGQDYHANKGGYYGGSTYRNRGEGNWQNESDYDESSYSGGWQRRDEDRDYNQNRSQYSNQGYYGNQGSRYGEYGYKNRNREDDYENSGSWGDSSSSNYRSSYRRFPEYDDYERGSYNNSGSRYRNYGGEYGGAYGSNRYGSTESNRGQQGYGQRYSRNYGSYGSGYYGSPRQEEQRERGWWDKTTDEVSSWFGDEDAERRREQDRRWEGTHRGKGPKGYQRSDERIRDDVNDRLSDDAFLDASNIDVTVSNGEVTLTGTVSERSDKRRAEDIAESVSGVKNVEVRLRVQEDFGGSTYRSPATGSVSTTTTSDKSKTRQSSLTESR